MVSDLGKADAVSIKIRDKLGNVAWLFLQVLSSLVLFPLFESPFHQSLLPVRGQLLILRIVDFQLVLRNVIISLVLVGVDDLFNEVDAPILFRDTSFFDEELLVEITI